MSNTRYLEFTSRYRDRNEYPIPSNFVVEISQTGQKPRDQAKDPVSDAAPVLYWNNSFDETSAANVSGNITVITTNSDRTILQVTATAGDLRHVDGFYDGAVLVIDIGGTDTQRRIIDYKYTDTSTPEHAQITLDRALPEGAFGTGTITQPTPFSTALGTTPQFFIPASKAIDNFYTNCIIQQYDGSGAIAETRTITAFDGTTHLATLDSPTTIDWAINGNANLNFIIRKSRPADVDTFTAVSESGTVVQLNVATTPVGQDYVTSYLRMIEPVPTNSPGFSAIVAPYGESRRIVKYITENGFFANSQLAGDSVFTFTNTASSVDNYYVGALLTVGGNTREVLTYDGSTRSGTISGTWGVAITANVTQWETRSAFLQSKFSVNPVVGGADAYEILQFTRDNWTPFAYNGSLVSSQQSVCYEVELINLILPNSNLQSGGRVAFYPYLYVQLENESSATTRTDTLIYSNNPNSNKMMFRAAVDDTPTPLISPFIKIDGDGMVQTVKFKPNDSFRFAIYLPNGELFQTTTQDTTSPALPDPLVQISALFSFKKV